MRSGQIDPRLTPTAAWTRTAPPGASTRSTTTALKSASGGGRVLWDILRPSVGRACRRAWETALFWECVEKAASTIECIRIARAQRGLVDDPLVIA